MAWDGYFAYDGNEVINVARTEAYAKNLEVGWFKPLFENDALPFMLGDGLSYKTPLLDDAPWVDSDVPDSLDFLGVYPLEVNGIEDSTREATTVQSLNDGGVPGRLRHATKTLNFNTILIGTTDAAVEYGFRWLKQALLGGPCGPSGITAHLGAELCYLASEPDMEIPGETDRGVMAHFIGGRYMNDEWVLNEDVVLSGGGVAPLPNYEFEGGTAYVTGGFITDKPWPFEFDASSRLSVDPEECLTPYIRNLRRVLFNTGPTVTSKRTLSGGQGTVWTVQFTATVGNPWELSAEVPVIQGFLDPEVAIPWVGGVEPEGAVIDLDGYVHPDADCAEAVYRPIYDPLFPAVVPPPGPPNIPLGNYSPPLSWRRRQFTIPRQYVPLWGEVVPVIKVHARTADTRNLRVRFYADPDGTADISEDPCAFCGDIVISYVPQDHTLVFDGAEQRVYVVSPGGSKRRADSLVYATDGTPFEWPALSCGFGYIVTLDLPQTAATPVVDLSLFSRVV
jgi:hypothetical protein